MCYNRPMLVILISWWYKDGLAHLLQSIKQRMIVIADFFSIGQLLATLFSPFRQISNVNLRPDAPVDTRIKAFGDKLISRFIGAFMRFLLILVGIVCLILVAIILTLAVVSYLLAPVLPLVCVVLFFVNFGGKSV